MKYTDTHRLKTQMIADMTRYLRRLICLFLTVSLCLSHSLVWAIPQITSAPATLKHKENITISGVNFGAKENATPLIWDDFEDGIDPGWTSATVMQLSSDNNRHSHSLKNTKGDFKGSDNSVCFSKSDTYATKWFLQFWFRLDPNLEWGYGPVGETPLASLKCFRLWAPGYGYCNTYIGSHHYWGSPGEEVGSTHFAVEGGTGGPWFDFDFPTKFVLGNWHLLELEFSENSALDIADGKVKWWHNGKLVFASESLVTSTTQYPKRGKMLGSLGFEHYWGHPDKSMYIWIDDAYVDTTWARVAISDAPTWSNCTHREIQIPVAWSDGSITFTANQGAFNDGQTAYLYVIDENGNVNEQGYPVRFGPGQTLQGDVNQDGQVDIKDLILVAKDFGKTSGFDSRCDVNKDGRVDIKDLIIVAKNFGRSL